MPLWFYWLFHTSSCLCLLTVSSFLQTLPHPPTICCLFRLSFTAAVIAQCHPMNAGRICTDSISKLSHVGTVLRLMHEKSEWLSTVHKIDSALQINPGSADRPRQRKIWSEKNTTSFTEICWIASVFTVRTTMAFIMVIKEFYITVWIQEAQIRMKRGGKEFW